MQSGHPWDIVRNNQLIKKFLDSDADIFVKMDVDQAYPQNYFLEMVPLVNKYKVVGPLIFDRHRSNDYLPLAFEDYNFEDGTFRLFDILDKKGVVEVPYSHTNLFYAREVLESILPPWYEAHATEDGCARANHVDYTFLDKIKGAGYPVHINPKVVVKHLATEPVSREFYERWHRGS
jgi:hypothetical protein